MIHLTRRQSIVLASGLIALFFFTLWLLSRKSTLSSVPVRERALATPTPAPQVTGSANAQFLLNDFHRSETKDGQKIWEVKARKGQYFPDKQMAQVFEADVWMFRDKGEQVFLKAPEAILGFEANALTKAVFPGTVHVVYNDKVTLDTSVATYDKALNTVFSDTTVTVVSDMMDLTGARFTADLTQNKIVFSGGVTTTIKPQRKK
jgi:LPS export ABC transporter protein LptC